MPKARVSTQRQSREQLSLLQRSSLLYANPPQLTPCSPAKNSFSLTSLRTWKQSYLGTITRTIATDGAPLYDIAFDDGERHEAVAASNVTPWTRTYSAAAAAAATVATASASDTKAGKTYTAPDGKTFTDRRAYRKYLKDVVFSFSDREGEVLCRGRGGVSVSGQNVSRLRKPGWMGKRAWLT